MVHYFYKVFWPRTQLSSASVSPLCVSFVKMPSCYPKHHIHGSVDLIDKLKGETPDPAGRERVRTSSIIDCLKWHNGSYNIDVKNSTNVSSATWTKSMHDQKKHMSAHVLQSFVKPVAQVFFPLCSLVIQVGED